LASTRRPKLGQHFLTSAAFRRRIADALPICADNLVIEIGAGRGAMTGLLAERAACVVAVELDTRLVEHLREEFSGREGIEIVQADILELNLSELCRSHGVEQAFIFGNLPYYITSPILHHLLESASHIRGMAFVVQREVAFRIAASPGSRAYGYLSVLAQCYSRPRIAFGIPPGAFSPPPAVQSALVTFEMTGETPGGLNGQAGASESQSEIRRRKFLEFVKLGFARKRKKLVNNLSARYTADAARNALRNLGLGEGVRAEELPVADLWRVFESLDRPR
jgi:16S rRNA (adenine1518-N6/adenine1519-N6)-dimethyltransferase